MDDRSYAQKQQYIEFDIISTFNFEIIDLSLQELKCDAGTRLTVMLFGSVFQSRLALLTATKCWDRFPPHPYLGRLSNKFRAPVKFISFRMAAPATMWLARFIATLADRFTNYRRTFLSYETEGRTWVTLLLSVKRFLRSYASGGITTVAVKFANPVK